MSKVSVVLGLAGLGVVWLTDREVASGTERVAAVPSAIATSGGSGGLVQPLRPATGSSRTLPGVEIFDAMVARPLFSADRRPFDPALEMASLPPVDWEPMPEAGPNYPSFRFIGSIEEAGRVRALLSDGFSVRSVVEGEEVERWTILAIETRRLVLAHDDERLELTILE